ncbi:MAG: DUF4881 domain-containing protein [Candidatus Korobacteraceae bacterium]
MAAIGQRMKLFLACAAALLTFGCGNYGSVDQGRVIAFDKQKGEITIIRDSAAKSSKPRYDVVPPVSVKIPADPHEMGTPPMAGKRLGFDTAKNTVIFFDANSKTIKTITYTVVTEFSNVGSDDPRVKGVQFPVVDRQNKVITLYSAGDKKLVKFTVADEYFSLPDDTWKSGDEIRYYYKQPGQALRLMNVTTTNVMKG